MKTNVLQLLLVLLPGVLSAQSEASDFAPPPKNWLLLVSFIPLLLSAGFLVGSIRKRKMVRKPALRKEAAIEITLETVAPTRSQADQEWLERFESFVRKNLSNNTLTVTWLAKEFAMSESTLLRQIKRLTGLSTQKYLIEIRLNEARKLLENRQFGSVSRVAYEVGYPDVKSFSRSFKWRFGKSPSEITDHRLSAILKLP